MRISCSRHPLLWRLSENSLRWLLQCLVAIPTTVGVIARLWIQVLKSRLVATRSWTRALIMAAIMVRAATKGRLKLLKPLFTQDSSSKMTIILHLRSLTN